MPDAKAREGNQKEKKKKKSSCQSLYELLGQGYSSQEILVFSITIPNCHQKIEFSAAEIVTSYAHFWKSDSPTKMVYIISNINRKYLISSFT